MALKTTPTIAICLTAAVAAGIGLARPGDRDPAPAVAVADQPAAVDPAADPAVDAAAGNGGTDAYGEPVSGGAVVDVGDAPANAPVAPAAPAVAAITIQDFAFTGSADVAAGGSIEVTNVDGAPHTLTFDDGSANTGNLGQGQTATLTAPATPGTYTFFCAIHPSMTGSIVVS